MPTWTIDATVRRRWLIYPRRWLPIGAIGYRIEINKLMKAYGVVIGTPLLTPNTHIRVNVRVPRWLMRRLP